MTETSTTTRQTRETREHAAYMTLASTVVTRTDDRPTREGIEVTPLYPGCTTTFSVWVNGSRIADLTQTPGSDTALAAFYTHGATGRSYRFPNRQTAIAAALCNDDRGYWYGEL